jgi:ribosomal protein S18 acetylase RimI-like enzyme
VKTISPAVVTVKTSGPKLNADCFEQLLALTRRSMGELSTPKEEEERREYLQKDGMVINYLRVGTKIVAYEAHNPNDTHLGEDVCFLYEIQIDKFYQRSGFGSLLFDEVERDAGKKPLLLQAHMVNTSACSFYLAKGCEQVKQMYVNGSVVLLSRKSAPIKPKAPPKPKAAADKPKKPSKADLSKLSALTEPVRRCHARAAAAAHISRSLSALSLSLAPPSRSHSLALSLSHTS